MDDILIRKQTVLYHDPKRDGLGDNDDGTFFANDVDDGPTLVLGEADWEDMGSPLEVTVTVEPGDTLNG